VTWRLAIFRQIDSPSHTTGETGAAIAHIECAERETEAHVDASGLLPPLALRHTRHASPGDDAHRNLASDLLCLLIVARIRTTLSADGTRVRIAGRLTASDLRRLEYACSSALVARPLRLEFELSGVTQIDASATVFLDEMLRRGATVTSRPRPPCSMDDGRRREAADVAGERRSTQR